MNNIWENSFRQREKTKEEKFWEKVDIKEKNECWEWKASKNKKGYGNFYVSIGNSKDRHWLAHRMSWKLSRGKIPKGMCVCHHCDNPGCVNPNHLFVGTNKDNVRDMIKKGRQPMRKGENSPVSKLTERDVRKIHNLRKKGLTYFELGDMFNVHYSTIGYICKGKLWNHVK